MQEFVCILDVNSADFLKKKKKMEKIIDNRCSSKQNKQNKTNKQKTEEYLNAIIVAGVSIFYSVIYNHVLLAKHKTIERLKQETRERLKLSNQATKNH